MGSGTEKMEKSTIPQPIDDGDSRSTIPQIVVIPSTEPGTSTTPQNVGDTGSTPPPVDDD